MNAYFILAGLLILGIRMVVWNRQPFQRLVIPCLVAVLIFLFVYNVRKLQTASVLTSNKIPNEIPNEIPKYTAQKSSKLDMFVFDAEFDRSKRTVTESDKLQKLVTDSSFYTQNMHHYTGTHERFLKLLNRKIWNRSVADIIQRREKNRQRILHALQDKNAQKIPPLTHCVWISTVPQAYPIPMEKIKRFFQQIHTFPTTFTHCLWFFDLKANVKNVQRFTQQNTQKRNLKFLDINDESVVTYGKDLFDLFYHQKRYTQCSDLVRFNLIYRYGGIYFDLGTLFNFEAEKVLWFDYFGYQEGFINSTTFVAAKPRSFVVYAFLNLNDSIFRFRDKEIRNLEANVSWSALSGWTWCMDNFLRDDELYLPIETSTGWSSTHNSASWLKGSFGQISHRAHPLRPQDYLFRRLKMLPEDFYSAMRNEWAKMYMGHFAKMDGISIETLRQNRRKVEKTFHELLFRDHFPKDLFLEPKIPRILHKTWLTHDREISDKQLQITFQTYQLLRQSYFPWRFIFWTNRIANIPRSIAFFRKHCPEMEIQEVNPSRDIPLARFIYKAFLDDGRYANANDILRLNLILTHGGLYFDMGVLLEYDITALLIPFENVFVFHTDLVDTGIVGAAPNDPLWQMWLQFLEDREYKKFDRALFPDASQQLRLTGADRTMHLLDSKFSDRKVLFLHDGFYIRLFRLGSWGESLLRSTVDLWKL